MITAEATVCREQEIRRAMSRPAIAWHTHPGWTVWAERHPGVDLLSPPPFFSDDHIYRMLQDKSIFNAGDASRLIVAPASDVDAPLYEIPLPAEHDGSDFFTQPMLA